MRWWLWATPVEIASALARLVRMRQIDSGDCAKARKLAKSLADLWSVIQPSHALRAQAARLVDRYDLRAGGLLAVGGGAGVVRRHPPRPCLPDRRPKAAGGGAPQRL